MAFWKSTFVNKEATNDFTEWQSVEIHMEEWGALLKMNSLIYSAYFFRNAKNIKKK